jgi:ubiquinone/menaquinone biosynthesis C-methylase UbiE/uncharacterized protein YbaR (Trm112 family)
MVKKQFYEILACPFCKSDVKVVKEKIICINEKCGKEFPIIDGIPVMLPQKLSKDLEFTQRQWNKEYKNRYNLEMIDLSRDPELKDSYSHVKKYIKKSGFFLEAGCGPSKLSCLLSKEGINTVGIDISFNSLKLAQRLFEREKVNGFLVCGDMLNMPFKDDIFSFIYTGGAIEHFEDTSNSVREIYRCLNKNGFTTNTVPCVSLSTPYKILKAGHIPEIFWLKEIVKFVQIIILKGSFMRFGYTKTFPAKKIEKIFKQAGFKNIEINLFKTYYPLEWAKNNSLKKAITRIANTKLFWPMIYVNGEK